MAKSAVAKIKPVAVSRVKVNVESFIKPDGQLFERAKGLLIAAGAKSDFWMERGGLPVSCLREIFGKDDVCLMKSIGLIKVKGGKVVVLFTAIQGSLL